MEEQEDFPSENVGRVYKKSDRSIGQVPTESVKFPPFFFKKFRRMKKKKNIRRFRNVSQFVSIARGASINSRLNISSNGIILNEIPFKEIGPT